MIFTRAKFLSLAATAPAATLLGTKPLGAQTKASTLPLRIGVVAVDQFAQAYYAQDMGIFASAGIAAEIMPIATGAQILAALSGGSLDVGITNTAGLAAALSHGAPFVVIAGAGLSNASAVLVGPPASSIKTAKDLEGKTVGVESLGDLTQIAPCVWMTQNGADFHKTKFIEVHFAEMAASIERGTVDAAMLTEPFLSAANGKTVKIVAKPYTAIAPEFLVSAWIATRDFVTKNPEAVKRFSSAMRDTARWANANHDRSAEILAKYSKIDLVTIKAMNRTNYATSADQHQLQPLFTQLYQYHAIDKPLVAADVIAIS
jgi:NitT/TauT family transport system substrate-binding protein